MRSSLAPHIVHDATSTEGLREKARAAWHRTPKDDDTWICIRLGDVSGWEEKELLRNLGNRLYGKRK